MRLRATAGFADIPIEHARKALRNGLINVSALKDGKLIGMGRLVDYAVKNSSTGEFTTIGGVSAKGKEGFYQKLGFEVISNGIRKMIEI